jgi:Ni,Fe-hydrogenase I large subunit
MGFGEQIIREVSSWDGVSANPHRFGGREFNLGKVEVGHVHGNSLVDVPFTRKIREALVTDGEAQPHHILPESGWISFYLQRDADVDQGVRLLRLSYLQKRMRRANAEARAAFEQEIVGLPISQHLKDVLLSRGSDDEHESDTE